MRSLVTGGAGALGSAVCRQLLASGHEVVIYDVVPCAITDADGAPVISVTGDIGDADGISRTIRTRGIDTVFHLVSLLSLESQEDPVAAVRVNALGMAVVLECARLAGVRRVVWASSNGVFARYNSPDPIGDDSPAYYPNNIYSGTKVLNELVATHYAQACGMAVIGLRLPLMVGVGTRRGRSGHLITELIDKPLRGVPGRVKYGDDVPSWLWLDDAARACVLAGTVAGARGRLFNVAGDTRPLHDAAAIVRELIPGAQITLEPGHYVTPHPVDVSAIEAELGFAPAWTLEEQMRELVRRGRDGSQRGVGGLRAVK